MRKTGARWEDAAMIISNRCILPEGWTVDTLMEPHDSIPYNPDIANVFYRAGFIENRGRGIETICSACRELGAEQPTYELRGNSLRVRFAALQSAIIDDSKTPTRQVGGIDGGLAGRIEEVILDNPSISQNEMADILNVPLRTIQRTIGAMKERGQIVRVGGNRYGHWEIPTAKIES